MTVHHRPAADDPAGCALSDADLAILAEGPERYADYVAGVRADFAHVAEADFRAGRLAVLQDLATKPSLFHSARGRELWEARARANLEREIAELSGA
jgi:predicted metal-dependent HD superfamily phosphohydrolase